MKKLLFLIMLLPYLSFSEEARILRYPNSSETHITFCHAGDVFIVPIEGGLARRVTSHVGEEMFPRFSPDGKTIAFSGLYDGNREVYTMPYMGGTPTRISYSMGAGKLAERHGPDKIVMHWQDDETVLYRDRQERWHIWTGHIYKGKLDGSLPEKFEMGNTGWASLSPDQTKMAYNRIFREYRTWKRYRGGQADDIWIYDLKTNELENITNHPSQDIIPMWMGNKIYYQSDRTGTMNIYSYNTETKETKQVTQFTEYDVKFASRGAKHVAFSNGGYVYLIDVATDEVKKVSIEIQEDFPYSRTEIVDLAGNVSSGAISPDGSRTVVQARGELFTVPKGKGNIHHLGFGSASHERNVHWSPDGKWISFVSDKSGEDEIYLMRPDGSESIQLTSDGESYRYDMKWSPDSKKLLASDKTMKLYYIDIDTKKKTVVRKSKNWEITDYNWSPDSRWITFRDNVGEFPVVFVYNLENKKTSQITSEFFQSYNPVFTPGGNYLLFVSDRTFRASIGNFEWNFAYNDLAKIYGVTLKSGSLSPFTYESDEYEWEEKNETKEEESKSDDVKVEIDLDGIQDRIFELPVSAGNYGALFPAKDHKLYYVKGKSGSPFATYYYDFKAKKEKKVGDFTSWDISADGKNILVVKGGSWFVESFNPNAVPIKPSNKLDFSDLKMELDHRAEWNQVFHEAWRQMKHFFYDPNMHGVDWDMIKTRYGQMLPHVNHRVDLTFIMGEMIAELNVGHAYVGGGEQPKFDEFGIGLLGCEFENHSSGAYKFKKIFKGRNWEEKTRSPLTEPGIMVSEGDYILAIDGQKLSKTDHPFKLLVDKVNKYVTITVNSKPSMEGAKEYKVKTIASESNLRYYNWVEEMRRRVDKATNGRVGYVHVPDMGVGNGLNEFVKYYYPQANKEGLIIDDRYNGGGNVSPMIIERLRREIAVAGNARNQEVVTAKPQGTMTGPVVALCNELSASDGDLFPYQFKAYNLGTLIGKRSWGGVIGIRGSLPFLDGGYLMKPEFANFGADGTWILEGVGMEPDIEVDNHPKRLMDGIDDQLNKAIEVVLEQIKTNKKTKIPVVPPHPDKTLPRDLRGK